MRRVMANAKALMLGSLLAFGCSSEASDGVDGALDDATDSNGAPTLANPGTGSQNGSPSGAQNGAQPPITPATSQPTPPGSGSQPVSELPTAPPLQTPADPSTQPGSGEPSGTETPPAVTGALAPVIPAVTEECPSFQTGTIDGASLRFVGTAADETVVARVSGPIHATFGAGDDSLVIDEAPGAGSSIAGGDGRDDVYVSTDSGLLDLDLREVWPGHGGRLTPGQIRARAERNG